ncbi:hypothetical protein CAC42_8164 [Sphaceloma murrayae]|uniref:Histone deacetylase complex subunit SAP18 n=1 Tax=Sphaceloma murrayae TaxID=2082308 RepID=A0A2K1QJX6_9PEZI|nr:hypothetical protein CAC42_8164 [Sphaceloma murrayae]
MALQPAPGRTSRTATPPFLLRLFYRQSSFHNPSEFTAVPPTPSLVSSSVTIYTWPDCTLSELTSHLTNAIPDLLPDPAVGTRIGFRLIFPDTRSPGAEHEGRGRWLSKELGSVVVGEDAHDHDETNGNGHQRPNNDSLELGRLTGDARKTLADARFVIGDYVRPWVAEATTAARMASTGAQGLAEEEQGMVPNEAWTEAKFLPGSGVGARGYLMGLDRITTVEVEEEGEEEEADDTGDAVSTLAY